MGLIREPARLRPAVLGVTIAMVGIAWLAMATPAGSKLRQPGCARFAKQVRKAKKPAARRAAKKRLRKCRAARRVRRMLKNRMIAGTRADGVSVASVYCASGAWSADGGTTFSRTGWRVENARFNGRNLTAIVKGKVKDGFYVTAVARRGKQWKVGWESSGRARDLGDAELTGARAACRGA